VDVFSQDIAAKVKGSHVQQIKIHGIVGKDQLWNFVDAPMKEIELRELEMMNQGISAERGRAGQQDEADKQASKKPPYEDENSSLFCDSVVWQ
jgi:hypothetical protein